MYARTNICVGNPWAEDVKWKCTPKLQWEPQVVEMSEIWNTWWEKLQATNEIDYGENKYILQTENPYRISCFSWFAFALILGVFPCPIFFFRARINLSSFSNHCRYFSRKDMKSNKGNTQWMWANITTCDPFLFFL